MNINKLIKGVTALILPILIILIFSSSAFCLALTVRCLTSEGRAIYNNLGAPNLISEGYRFDIIQSTDGIIDPPDASGYSGLPTVNDTLITSEFIGYGSYSSGEAFKTGLNFPNNQYVYIRVWQGINRTTATYYNESAIKNVGNGFIYTFTSESFATTKTWNIPSPPTVTSVTKNYGYNTARVVALVGTGFTGTTAVSLDAVNLPTFTVNSDTSISLTIPAASAVGPHNIRVTNANGTSAIGAGNLYTVVGLPTVTSVTPSSGPSPNTVSIGGTNLLGDGTDPVTVTINGSTVTFTPSANNTTITNIAVPGSLTVGNLYTVTVTNPVGPSVSTPPGDQYLVTAAPTVTSISPASGASPNTGVTINGTNFTGVTSIVIGATPIITYTYTSATQITNVSIPAGLTNGTAYDIRVTTGVGQSPISQPADQYTVYNVPTVTGVAPSSGPSPSTGVTITGTNFIGTSAISINGVPITVYTVTNNTTISNATIPAGILAGSYDIRVTNPAGQSPVNAPADQYTVVAQPTVTSISPASGASPNAGVTINGTSLSSVTSIVIGATPIVTYTLTSATQITNVSIPAGLTNGTAYDIRVTNPGGQSPISQPADQYTVYNVPTVTGVAPSSGPSPSTGVTITGTNFIGTSAITINGVPITVYTVTNNTTISNATIPAGIVAGSYDIRVTNPAGQSPLNAPADQYTVTAPPTVTLVSPPNGANTANTPITITGTNFTGATWVHLGATDLPGFIVNSATQITVTVPSGLTAGTYDITVNTPNGTSAPNVSDRFTVTGGGGGGGGNLIYVSDGGVMMAYPNPFNPDDKANPLKLLFSTATGEAVDVYMFDANGRVIWQEKDNALTANRTVTWDGDTSWGEQVENGLYLIRVVKDGKLVAKGKILVIKK